MSEIPKQVCKKCGRELTLRQVVKIYEDKYRVWCACSQENFYYKDWKKEYDNLQTCKQKKLEEKEDKKE